MESPDLVIARLVLGYLKSEHCRTAYKEFLRTSPQLLRANAIKNKFISTRFVGLTLVEILNEYFKIHKMVQARLEATSYFREHHSRRTLPSQVLYLFNKGPNIDVSRASTPCHRSSPIPSQFGETSPSCIDPCSDTEATPIHTLPGNTNSRKDESYPAKTPKKKMSRTDKEDTSSDESDVPKTPQFVNTEVLAQTLLDNKEFHEKIAKTINKVAEKQHRGSVELDKTVKTVVKETENDPIFDKLLDEIIDSAAVGLDVRFDADKNSDGTKITADRSDKSSKSQDGSEVPENVIPSGNKTDQHSNEVNKKIGESVQSERGTPEVVVYEGSLDSYLSSNNVNTIAPPVPTVQNQVYVNATPVLIATTGTTPPGYSCATMATLPCGRSGSAVQGATWPQIPTVMFTEQDILTMPTVFVTDSNVMAGVKKKNNGEPRPIRSKLPTKCPKPETSAPGKLKVLYPVTSEKQNVETLPPSSIATSTPSAVDKPSLPPLMTENEEKNLSENVEPAATPPVLSTAQKVTPKSGSHVRNLDFSTPPKLDKKELTKMSSKKQVTKSLFPKKSEVLVDVDKAWDADLRDLAQIGETQEKVPEKQKKDIPEKKRTRTPDRKKTHTPKKKKKQTPKKKGRKPKRVSSPIDEDGAALEAALQTPVKSQRIETERTKSTVKTVKCATNTIAAVESACDAMSADVEPTNPTCSEEVHKTILSPSKLNASKRSLVNTDEKNTTSKFITPENVQDVVMHPIKANRNIMPLLETPIKSCLPKTPGAITPHDLNFSVVSNNTPFTKMLEANLKGVDISQLPTLNIPITPNFPPFTPNVEGMSSCSNRPTDYSASSSYYQPSDNEQNKSLETHLREIEKKSVTNEPRTDEILNIFNKNMVGRKNLSLMKKPISSSSSSSDEFSDNSSTDLECKTSNDTVIRKASPVRRYSLRTRNAVNNKTNEDINSSKQQDVKNALVVKKCKNGQEVDTSDDEFAEFDDSEDKAKKVAATIVKKVPEKRGRSRKVKLVGAGTRADKKSGHVKQAITAKDELDIQKLESQVNSQCADEKTKESKEPDGSVEKDSDPINETNKSETTEVIEAVSVLKACLMEMKPIEPATPMSVQRVDVEKGTKDESSATIIQRRTSKSEKDVVTTTVEDLNTETSTVDKSTEKVKVEPKEYSPSFLTHELALQKELGEKRKRTITKVKGDQEEDFKPNKSNFKIKPIANVTKMTRKPRKAITPKKAQLKYSEDIRLVMEDLHQSDDSDLEPWSPMKLACITPDVTSSDAEAQHLIEGLKERGIHLVPNRSPKKKSKSQTDQLSANGHKSGEQNISPNTSLTLKFITSDLDCRLYDSFTECVIFDKSTMDRIKPYVKPPKIKSRKIDVSKVEENSVKTVTIKHTRFHSLFTYLPAKDDCTPVVPPTTANDVSEVSHVMKDKEEPTHAKENIVSINDKSAGVNSEAKGHKGEKSNGKSSDLVVSSTSSGKKETSRKETKENLDEKFNDLMNFAVTGHESLNVSATGNETSEDTTDGALPKLSVDRYQRAKVLNVDIQYLKEVELKGSAIKRPKRQKCNVYKKAKVKLDDSIITDKRTGWTSQDLSKLHSAFYSHIKAKIYPPTEEIQAFIQKSKIEKTVGAVRAKVQHLIKKYDEVKTKTREKKCWTYEELRKMYKEFYSYIESGVYPSAEKIKIFIRDTKTERSVVAVRAKVQHLIKRLHCKK